jgi:hypothetical protein
MNDDSIERTLRKAPPPAAPEHLEETLRAGIRLPSRSPSRENDNSLFKPYAWLGRRMPELGGISLRLCITPA